MKIDRSISPQPIGGIEFQLPKFNEFALNNGIKVLFVKKDNLPIVQLNLIVDGGSKFDPPNKCGLAHLTALLIDEGAGEYDSLQLDDEFESLGSIFGVSTDNDKINLSLMTLRENLTRSLELLSTVYQSPNFSDNDFAREQKKLVSKITQSQDDPSFVANSNFDRIIFNDTNYQHPIIGNIHDVNSITNNDVKNFYKDHFLPSNSQFVIVGNIELKELEVLLNQCFTNPNKDIYKKEVLPKPSGQKSKFYFIHKENAAQSEIRIGHISDKRNETDYIPKIIANSILGGQFSSRLNLNLREDKGFTYGISSAFIYYQDAGYFEISTSVNGKDTHAAIKEIQKEIEGIKLEITSDEIEFTKSYLIKRFPAMFETYTQVARNLSTIKKHSLPKKYFDNYIDNINTCSKSDIEKIIDEKIILDELIYLVVGDRKLILPELKKEFGLDIIELDIDGNIKQYLS